MKLRFEVEITEDHHPIRRIRQRFPELGEDVAGAVADHPLIEGNAVECTAVELITATPQEEK